MRSRAQNLKGMRGLALALPLLLSMAVPAQALASATAPVAPAGALTDLHIAPTPPPALLAGQVRDGAEAETGWTGTAELSLPDTPLDNPLRPDAPDRPPFDDPPPEAGVVSSRVGVAGKGLTLGVEMPF